MLFICSHKTCPEHVEPCIFSMDDMFDVFYEKILARNEPRKD